MKLNNLTKPQNKKHLMKKFVDSSSHPPSAPSNATNGIPELPGTNGLSGSGGGTIINPKYNGLMGLK